MDFDELLSSKQGQQHFMEFLKREFSHENLEFYLQCQEFKKITDKKQMKKVAEQIFNKYISLRGAQSVNIDCNTRKYIELCLKKPNVAMFDAAQSHIYQLMKTDPFPRFLHSESFSKYQSTQSSASSRLVKDDTSRKRKRNEIDECTNSYSTHTYENQFIVKNAKYTHLQMPSDPGPSGSLTENGEQNFQPNVFQYEDREPSDCESLYCNAPIYSLDSNTDLSQLQQRNNLVDPKWFNNRFIRVIFPDCSEEFISISQKAPIRFIIDNLLRDKAFNFSSYKMFSLNTNELIDIDKDISSAVLNDARIEQRINFSLHFPEGYLIDVETVPNKLPFYTLKTILSHFGISWTDIEMFSNEGHLLNEVLLTEPSFNLDRSNIHVNYLSSLRTYINLNDISDLNEDGITIKGIQFKECIRLAKSQCNSQTNSLPKSYTTFIANHETNPEIAPPCKSNSTYANLTDEIRQIDLAELSFSNENATNDFLADIMLNDTSKLNFVCTPKKSRQTIAKQSNEASHLYENIDLNANSYASTPRTSHERTPVHKAKLVIIDDNEYENGEFISTHNCHSQTVGLPDMKDYLYSKSLYMNGHAIDNSLQCHLNNLILKERNASSHMSINKRLIQLDNKKAKSNSPISFTKYLLKSSSSTSRQSIANSHSPSNHNPSSKAKRIIHQSSSNNNSYHKTPLKRTSNPPDLLLSSNKKSAIRTLSRFHKIA